MVTKKLDEIGKFYPISKIIQEKKIISISKIRPRSSVSFARLSKSVAVQFVAGATTNVEQTRNRISRIKGE